MGVIKKRNSLLSFRIKDQWLAAPLNLVEGVTAMPEIIAIPGQQSRVLTGLCYAFGQIMGVVDIAPLFNLGRGVGPKKAVVLDVLGNYYAVQADEVGDIVSKVRKTQRKGRHSIFTSYVMIDKKKVYVIDVDILIEKHVCT